MTTRRRITTPLCGFELEASPAGLRAIRFLDPGAARAEDRHSGQPTRSASDEPEGARGASDPAVESHLRQAEAALRSHLAGPSDPEPTSLPPFDLDGHSEFHRWVWNRLRRIPRGEVLTYGAIAEEWGDPGAARAVGGAVGANPLSVLIPCHRVVAVDGRLGGFSGGLSRKAELLRGEGVDVSGEVSESRVVPGALRFLGVILLLGAALLGAPSTGNRATEAAAQTIRNVERFQVDGVDGTHFVAEVGGRFQTGNTNG